jgi:Fic family protein
MEVERLRGSPIGSLVRIRGHDARFMQDYDHWAYVPNPLPPTVELRPSTWSMVGEAMLALGRLDQAGRQLPDPALLRRPTLRSEAQATSALEGTYAALSDVLEAEPGDAPEQLSPQLREVLNYVRMAEFAYAEVVQRPISLGLVLDLHRLLVARTAADGPMAGAVRTHQAVIGGPRTPVPRARFVPPPPGPDLFEALRDWVSWVGEPSELNIVVRAALAHYQLEALHPFHDGNGRIGRLLIVLQLLRAGVFREPLLTISPWFESRRRDYQDHLQHLSETGDWDQWVAFFAEGVRDQAASTADKVSRLLAYQEATIRTARDQGLRGLVLDLVESLIGRPVFSISTVAELHAVTRQAASAAVGRLVDLKILRETTGGNYARLFAADEVVGILEA